MTFQSVMRKVLQEKGGNQFDPPHLSKQKMRHNGSELFAWNGKRATFGTPSNFLQNACKKPVETNDVIICEKIRELNFVTSSRRKK